MRYASILAAHWINPPPAPQQVRPGFQQISGEPGRSCSAKDALATIRPITVSQRGPKVFNYKRHEIPPKKPRPSAG